MEESAVPGSGGTTPKRRRPKIGDVVRITAAAGSAFAQYTHKDSHFGALVRVIGPANGSSDPVAIAARPTQFLTFFPLGAACHRGIAEIVGAAPVPADLIEFPCFREPLRLFPERRERCNWRLWDGRDEWIVPELSNEQRAYPLREIINDTLLVERARAGWRAIDDQ
jgi:hypothetical protein